MKNTWNIPVIEELDLSETATNKWPKPTPKPTTPPRPSCTPPIVPTPSPPVYES